MFFISDQADISAEIDDEQSTVASDDNGAQQQTHDENDKREISAPDASPLSLETISQPISACSTPAPSTTPIASPLSGVDAGKPSEAIETNNRTIELPKLRLNVTLAADPALQPEAKRVCIRPSADNYDTESNCDNEMRDETPSPTILVHDDNGPPEKIRRRDDSAFRSAASKFVVNLQSPNTHSTATVAPADISPRIPAFICAPCGIKFSSISTLEAHQTFYCSHR